VRDISSDPTHNVKAAEIEMAPVCRTVQLLRIQWKYVYRQFKYRCLFSSVPFGSPASDLGYFSSERSTQVDGSVVKRELVDGGPELELVAFALALVAVVAPLFQVD